MRSAFESGVIVSSMVRLRRDNAAAYVLGSVFAPGGCNELLGLEPGELEDSSASSLETVGAGEGGAASGSVGSGGFVGSEGEDSQGATGSTSATGGAGGADTVTSTGIGSTTASTGGAVACEPNSSIACYDGPANTMNVGLCKEGTATCDPEGLAYGPCEGQILPITESCGTSGDDDCDGSANEGCGSLTCSLYSENFDDGVARSRARARGCCRR